MPDAKARRGRRVGLVRRVVRGGSGIDRLGWAVVSMDRRRAVRGRSGLVAVREWERWLWRVWVGLWAGLSVGLWAGAWARADCLRRWRSRVACGLVCGCR